LFATCHAFNHKPTARAAAFGRYLKGNYTMTELMQILIQRDKLTRDEAAEAIAYARHLVYNEGADPEEVLQDEFGLEPDYVFDLI
jgi:hypothetical protein